MRALSAATVAVTVAIGLVATAPAARGQCGKPDLVDMVPPDGADDVPRNAKLGAHYATSAEYLGEDVVLVHPDGSEQLLDATWDPTEQFLSVVPSSSALTADSSYEIRWPVLRGLNAAAPGLGGTARFTTGAGFDAAPPTFAGVAGLSWDYERKISECVDETVERFVFDVDLGAAADDGGIGGLTLMLFQTKGPRVLGMPVPIPARAWPQSGTRAQVRLTQAEGVGEVCFAGLVRDTLGQVSEGGDVEACVHTTDPPFFNGCSVAGANGTVGAHAWLLVLAGLMFRRRTRAHT